MITRREALRAVGTLAASAGLAAACGGSGGRRRLAAVSSRQHLGELREVLRETVRALGARYADASAHAVLRRRGGAAVDASERGASRDTSGGVLLSVRAADGYRERVTTELSRDGIAAAAAALVREVAAGGGDPAFDVGAPRDFSAEIGVDPADVSTGAWLERAIDLYEQAEDVGSSRIVYRGSYVTVDDTEILHVGRGRDLAQRLVRTRAGVLVVAWTGATPIAESAERAGLGGLELAELPEGAIRDATDRALTLLTPAAGPRGPMPVVLDPSLAALLAYHGVGRACAGDGWASGASALARRRGETIASAAVTVIDDPTLAGGYGGFFFDDQGHVAAPVTLIDEGVVRSPLVDRDSAAALDAGTGGHARRAGGLGVAAPCAGNIGVAPGDATLDDLLSATGRGLLLEGGVLARADVRDLRVSLRAARGREIEDGKLTGRIYGTIDLHGDLPGLLSSVRGVTGEVRRYASSWTGDDGAVAISIAGPHVATEGVVSS